MSIKLAALQHMIQGLSPDEWTEFRRWYARYDAEMRARGPEPATGADRPEPAAPEELMK
ncbi:MAG: hypothetical protein ABI886_09880 [Betaproteobacteria bacterium]